MSIPSRNIGISLVSQTHPEQGRGRSQAWSWEDELGSPGCLGRRSKGYFVYTTLCSWFKARIFVFFSLAWTSHFNFMKKQFEIDWGKIIFSLKPRDPNWPVNRRGVELIFEDAGPQAIRAKVSFGLTPSQMMDRVGPEPWTGVLGQCLPPEWGGVESWASRVPAGSSKWSCRIHLADLCSFGSCLKNRRRTNPKDKKKQLHSDWSRIA